MNQLAALALLQGIILTSLPITFSLGTRPEESLDKNDFTYDVTTKLSDDVKESTFSIKCKCRQRNRRNVACRLYDSKHETKYYKPRCENSSLCENDEDGHLVADNSYDGNFEINFVGARVENLTVSSGTSLKQLSFYRIIANHLFMGVNVLGKSDGTYPMIEESVYGKCAAIVKIVHALADEKDGIPTTTNDETIPNQLVSVTRTRNLDTCLPVPGLLLYDSFLYHPMMASVHYDIKSSISRFIATKYSFTSYTTEEISVKSLEGDGNTTMLHVRTTLTLQSNAPATDSIPPIIHPISVALPFIDGFRPANDNNDNMISKNPENAKKK